MRNFLDIKLLKFGLVGIVNTITGVAIMFGLYNICNCTYWISSATNYFFASILSYVLNKKITFNHRGKLVKSGFRFAINIGICYFIAYGIAKPYTIWVLNGSSQSTQENIAMFGGMVIFTGLNYVGQRLFVFKGEKN